MTLLLQYVASGLAQGAVYALVAMGFSLIFKSTGIMNFAHGILMTVGAYLAVTITRSIDVPFAVAVLLVLGLSGALGALTYALLLRPLAGQPLLSTVMITFAFAIVVRSVLSIVYGPLPQALNSGLPSGATDFGPITIPNIKLAAAVVSLLILLAFAWMFKFTRLGLLMRAGADNHEAAVISGVPVDLVNVAAWSLGAMLSALGGIFLASADFAWLGLEGAGLLAIPAVVIGGLHSISGAVVGGVLVGVVEQLASGYIAPQASSMAIYAVLIAVLLIRPWGIFGRPEVGRV